jgi:hypothetical protein
VDTTITGLREALAKATERLPAEQAEFEAKRDRMVRVAHSRGTNNSIGSSLDDLLEEFDLPRRGEAVTMFGILMVSEPIDPSQTAGFYTSGSNYVYTQPGTRASWPVAFEHLTNVPQGSTCACERSVDVLVKDYITSNFGATRAANMHYQIGAVNCGASGGCVNGERRRYDASQGDHGVDWSSKPVIVHTPPAPPAPAPAGITPQVGETWYMVGNDTHDTGCHDGEPVVILSTTYRIGVPLQVRRVNGGDEWELHLNEVRATATVSDDPNRTPQVGETWYLHTAHTFGASNTTNEPVTIVSITGDDHYNVRRADDREGYARWYFRREHLHSAPSA